MKLKMVQEFYLKNSCRSLISEKLFLSYFSVCRVIREYELDFKAFNGMFKSRYAKIDKCPTIESRMQ